MWGFLEKRRKRKENISILGSVSQEEHAAHCLRSFAISSVAEDSTPEDYDWCLYGSFVSMFGNCVLLYVCQAPPPTPPPRLTGRALEWATGDIVRGLESTV